MTTTGNAVPGPPEPSRDWSRAVCISPAGACGAGTSACPLGPTKVHRRTAALCTFCRPPVPDAPFRRGWEAPKTLGQPVGQTGRFGATNPWSSVVIRCHPQSDCPIFWGAPSEPDPFPQLLVGGSNPLGGTLPAISPSGRVPSGGDNGYVSRAPVNGSERAASFQLSAHVWRRLPVPQVLPSR